ncbi:hypothetical protein PVW46_25075 [Mameliella sp. AT18]|uniref:hypothetical protein n=1 Tax=Mameliella sp. AT18 TaxID=3028385 RepID=UPI001112CFB2|nr:hypothetical protein [Mameliella sp. AT18]MDD9733187.1 hypothetical protein [Mameliella sp. AT18]
MAGEASRDTLPVRNSFGDCGPMSDKWGKPTSAQAALLPERFRDFRAGLMTGESFVFELTDFRGSRSNARFPETTPGDRFGHVIGGRGAS